MSELHRISGCEDSARNVDVLFIHGLGGDAFKTWCFGNDKSTSWIHWLGSDFPDIGFWSLGYAASPSRRFGLLRRFWGGSRDAGQSMALPRRATQVLNLLVQNGFGQRPIVFIAHSLGGLLAKQILWQSADSLDSPNQSVFNNTRAVLFLATPHGGAKLATLVNSFRSILGATVSIEDLREHDAHLENLLNWYRHHSVKAPIQTVTYYEDRDLHGFRIVSATSAHPGVGPDPIALDEDHVSIAKPRNREAQVYCAVRGLLKGLTNPASSQPLQTANRPPEPQDSLCPPLPACFLPRESYLLSLGSVFSDVAKGLRPVRIVFGQSGTGKTVAVADFVRSGKFRERAVWIDSRDKCWVDRKAVEELRCRLQNCALAVFDNVASDAEILKREDWIADLSGTPTVFITNDPSTALRLQGICACGNRPETLLDVQPFNDAEITDFLLRAAIKLPPGFDIGRISKSSRGLPVVLQLVRALLQCNCQACLSILIKHEGDWTRMVWELLCLWIYECNRGNPTVPRVMLTISQVSFMGMNRSALAEVLNVSQESLTDALQALQRQGFITSNGRESIDRETVYMPHDLVRKAIVDSCQEQPTKEYDRYYEYLKKLLCNPDSAKREILTIIDAWIVAWRRVFTDDGLRTEDEISKRRREVVQILELIQPNKELYQTMSEGIVAGLSRVLHPDCHCAIIIAASGLVRSLPPSLALANIIWQGAKNDDGWARAASIAATVRHWTKLDLLPPMKKEVTARILEWTDFAYERFRSGDPAWTRSDPDIPNDFDFCPAIAGFCILTSNYEGATLLSSPRLQELFPTTSLSHLAVLVRLADNRETAYTEKLLQRQWKRIEPSFTAARVFQYLQSSGLRYPGRLPPLEDHQRTLALEIANATQSENLSAFVHRKEGSHPACY